MYGFKSPCTRQEMALSVDPDHAEYVRVKRRFRNLPDAYDDVPRGRRARPDKYKKHRRRK